jgi:phenylalanyl-tRNA synthetase beta chain
VSDVSVFDVFQMPDGKKSIAIAVTLQPRDQTLTDKDIEAISAKIVAQVGKATGGTLRS